MEAIQKYLCTLKLIDATVNPKKLYKGSSYLSVTCFSKEKDEVPQDVKMGFILRIHRGDIKEHKNAFQLNCDSSIKGAWALFHSSDSTTPIQHTGNTYTFLEEDKKRLKDVRKFGESFFAENDLTEASVMEGSDDEIDLFCLVIRKKEKENGSMKFVAFDGKAIMRFQAPKDRYLQIMPQDIVRIRGLINEDGKLIANFYTNVMKVENSYCTAEEFRANIEAARQTEEMARIINKYIPPPDKSLPLSTVLDKKPKLISLKELFDEGRSFESERRFRVNVSVIDYGPKDFNTWLVNVDSKIRKSYNLPPTVTHYYKMQFFVKDLKGDRENRVHALFLCSVDGRGREFFGEQGGKTLVERMKESSKYFLKPWYHLDAVVEAVANAEGRQNLFIVDTKLIV
eukprot:TRINITY_DN7886_c0_g1_i20.p1 TRINITY_DN7886_c0_g1~~TRINITY_DN7886_c0_g1_i20.p1  ORF type:complete len:398 (-),score=126.30 TRINITY_DN7886_c0_g1_i20:126-1319(-)